MHLNRVQSRANFSFLIEKHRFYSQQFLE
uniref:Uncharacterized protein n=1 Tax=Arundo donax TaxID=35708 RepID=A0A0A9HDP0_ARUDO